MPLFLVLGVTCLLCLIGELLVCLHLASLDKAVEDFTVTVALVLLKSTILVQLAIILMLFVTKTCCSFHKIIYSRELPTAQQDKTRSPKE